MKLTSLAAPCVFDLEIDANALPDMPNLADVQKHKNTRVTFPLNTEVFVESSLASLFLLLVKAVQRSLTLRRRRQA